MKTIYNKLVRDNIPDIIESKGKKCTYRVIENKKELFLALADKLMEEAFELKYAIETNSNYLEELGDITSVLFTILDDVLTEEEYKLYSELRLLKDVDNGGFENHIYLESVEE